MNVREADRAIAFYKEAFVAEEHFRLTTTDGKIGHADITIGDAVIMLVDEMEEWKNGSPESFGGSPLSLMVYVGDADQMVQQALAAGATEKEPVKDPLYGDRSGTLTDPSGPA